MAKFWKSKTTWKWAGVILLAVGLFVASRFLPFAAWIKGFTEWIQGKGALGVAIFILSYIVGTIVFFPGALMTISAGIIFGLGWGTLIASFSATLGASFSFLIGRYLARDKVEKRAHKNEKLRAIDAAIGEQGWKIVGLLRLSPFIPFNFSNYFFGITKIRFWPYVLASWIGMLPGTLLYVYLGHIGKATFGGGHQRTTQEYVFLGVGLVATIALTIYLTRLAKKALKKQNGAEHIEKT